MNYSWLIDSMGLYHLYTTRIEMARVVQQPVAHIWVGLWGCLCAILPTNICHRSLLAQHVVL